MSLNRCTSDATFLRNLSLMWIVRATDVPPKRILGLRQSEVLFDGKAILFDGILLENPPAYVNEFLTYHRHHCFSQTDLLFPTLAGAPLKAKNFSRQIDTLLATAGINDATAVNLRTFSDRQWLLLENLRFDRSRQRYQIIVAGTLCAYLGLRPSEVAKLCVRDFDLDEMTVLLRDTKSQLDQLMPLLPFMIEPLRRYFSHLGVNDSLFITLAGRRWERRDVLDTLVTYGKSIGIQSHVTPRRLRASLAKKLVALGAPPALVARFLRHTDPATAIRHYNLAGFSEIRNILLMMDEDCLTSTYESVDETPRLPNFQERRMNEIIF